MKDTPYDKGFYEAQRAGSERSANVIIPIFLERFTVRSVLDVGCGIGTWLRAFSNHGISDLTGLDGDYVSRNELLVQPDVFQVADLSLGFVTGRRYDLACSLEVAEHLPQAASATFVASLCKAAPIVIFSAAIPGQGGTDHINEAWQDSWRQHFAANGYASVDFLRPRIWGNREVEWWYQQNVVVYVDQTALQANPGLEAVGDDLSLNLVHPDCYEKYYYGSEIYLSKALRQIPGLAKAAARRRLGALLGRPARTDEF